MDRMKMVGGMVLGAVVLHLGFMACTAQSPNGRGVLGGGDASAQEMPCARWEIKYVDVPGDLQTNTTIPVEAGWEPFSTEGNIYIIRRCAAR